MSDQRAVFTKDKNTLYFDINQNIAPIAFPEHFNSQKDAKPILTKKATSKDRYQKKMTNWDVRKHIFDPKILMALQRSSDCN